MSGEGKERRQEGEQLPLEHLHLHLLEEGAGGGTGRKVASADAGAIEVLISSSGLLTLLASEMGKAYNNIQPTQSTVGMERLRLHMVVFLLLLFSLSICSYFSNSNLIDLPHLPHPRHFACWDHSKTKTSRGLTQHMSLICLTWGHGIWQTINKSVQQS